MAIMWDPPADKPSLQPTAAELAWKRWLLQALLADDDTPDAPSQVLHENLKPAA